MFQVQSISQVSSCTSCVLVPECPELKKGKTYIRFSNQTMICGYFSLPLILIYLGLLYCVQLPTGWRYPS
ncbi:hypothetical protein JHK84_047998 [Glycine max]|nr:hypothetical protein JHK84_047998 [Glycine max]